MSRKKRNNVPVFGKKLTALRKGLHLTQSELAERVSITKEMINYLENRAQNPTLDQIKKFADFFNVPADELIYGELDRKRKPGPLSNLEKQVEKLQRLPKTTQKIISEMIDGVLKTAVL
jgi:transcriptional regulator with XRE-family HTH domain